MNELKPCPFCGNDVHMEAGYSYFHEYVVYCNMCDTVFTLDACYASENEVREAWNRRVSDDQP